MIEIRSQNSEQFHLIPLCLHDRDRQTCRLCGECDIGCNVGAKNSLDYNYLTLAVRAGAEIRTLAEVKGLEPVPEVSASR